MLKKILSKNKNLFKRKYTTSLPFDGKYTQEKNESKNAKILREAGKEDETKYKGKTTLEKIFTNNLAENDLKDIDFKDPEVVKRWMADVAVKGPKFQFVENESDKLKPVVVTVTGAAGQIAYSLLPRIAAGDMLGENQPIILKLIEMPGAMKALEGTVMELRDCAFPLLKDIVATSDLKEGFTDADFCLLVGSKPRTKGMERGDLLKENGISFVQQGRAINHYADPNVLTLVVGNPANTNALVAAKNSPNLDPSQYTAMTRLDHDRGLAQIATKANCKVTDIERFCIWGNHSATQFPDLSHTLINGKWARDVINDDAWITDTFIPTVQQRGAAIIEARGKSSAASAASAAIAHVRDWALGTTGWQSMAIYSTGQNGVDAEVYSSFPVICSGGGRVDVVGNVPFSEDAAARVNTSVQELLQEKEAVKHLFPPVFRRMTEVPSDEIYSWKWLAEIMPKEHIDSIVIDREYLSAAKVELIKSVPLKGTPSELTLPWSTFNWEEFANNIDNVDFSGLKSLQTSRKMSEVDAKRFHLVALKSLNNDLNLIERKYKKVYLDLEDRAVMAVKEGTDLLGEDEEIKFHLERINEDGKLSNGGIDTKSVTENLVVALIKSKPKFYFDDILKNEQ